MRYKNFSFGKKLMEYRNAQKPIITLEDLADRMNKIYAKDDDDPKMRANYLSAIETEKRRPNLDTVLRICDALDVRFDELSGR